jgi:hypothetical protein
MIITTIIAGAILGAAAIAVLSLAKIKDWLRGRRATKYGDLVKKEMENGNVEIIAIGLDANYNQTGEKKFTAKSLDPELAATFGYSRHARITV